MNIEYLTQLSNNPTVSDAATGVVDTLSPITMDEILTLESNYNNGNTFPVVLRELLFLAGESCYVLDYGVYGNQTHIQNAVRSWLIKSNRQISRPFFAIDVYNSYSQFLFVYLDEGIDDPLVRQAILYSKATDSSWSTSIDYTLSEFINRRMTYLLNGYNPF